MMDYKKEKSNILKSLKEDMEELKKKGGAMTLPLPIYQTSSGETFTVIKLQKYSCDSAEWYDVRKLKNLIDMVVDEINKSNGFIAKAEDYYNCQAFYDALVITTKPCKEFSQLSRYIAKYAKFDVSVADMFSAPFFVLFFFTSPIINQFIVSVKLINLFLLKFLLIDYTKGHPAKYPHIPL